MLEKVSKLNSASELAANCKVRFPNESTEYRRARTALLAEEIELRRHIERVAAQRRSLPPGGKVKNYQFVGEAGPIDLAGMFGDKRHIGRSTPTCSGRSARSRARCARRC